MILDLVTVTLPDVEEVPEGNQNILADIIDRSLQSLLDQEWMPMLEELDMPPMMAAVAAGTHIFDNQAMSRHGFGDKVQCVLKGDCCVAG
jgi:hypothetical protein